MVSGVFEVGIFIGKQKMLTNATHAAVFSSVELVDWMLGFSKGK